MSRVQLALNVADIDEAVDFYSKLFAVAPAKRKPGYANFAVTDPPLKLVLLENKEGGERLNHLGIEVGSPAEVRTHQSRLTTDGVESIEDSGTCCFAEQEKVWVEAPDGQWEIYAVVADVETFSGTPESDEAVCCATT